MKILFLTHRLPYAPNRGDRIRAHHLLRTLSRTSAVHLVSLAHDEDEARHAPALSALASSVDVVPVRRWRRLVPAAVSLVRRTPLTHALLYSNEVARTIERTAQRVVPDVVLAYCSGMGPGMYAPALASTPCVLDLVDVDSVKWRHLAEASGPPARWIYAREARLLAKSEQALMARATATTVVSVRERGLLPAALARSVSVVGNGIDLDGFAPPGSPAEAPLVVFTGVFDYPPNVQAAEWLATRVWPIVRRRRPDARLSLVGMNPHPSVRRLTRDPSVEVTGAVPDIRPYLWRSAVAVAPLLVARGLQNKVLEALAAGLPVVVTPAVAEGLPAEALPGCVIAGSPESFASAIGDLLEGSAEGRRTAASRADLRSLSWDRQLAPMVAILEQVAQR